MDAPLAARHLPQTLDPSYMLDLRWLLALALFLTVLPAHANFFWPPMLYLFSFTLWWVVVGGLVVEALIHRFLLPASTGRAVAIAVSTNLVSALLGTLLLLPVLMYTPLTEALPERMLLPAIIVAVVAIPVVNIAIEYLAGTRLWSLGRTRRTLVTFVAANLLSFGLVLYGVSFIKLF